MNKIKAWIFFGGLFAALGIVFFCSLAMGASDISFSHLLRWIASGFNSEALSSTDLYILRDLRLPRTLLALFVGGGLALTGAVVQTLFRNPLADPSLLGISSGSAFCAAIFLVGVSSGAILLPSIGMSFFLPLCAFLGGLVTLWLLVQISQQGRGASTSILLLSGIALNALAGSAIGFLSYFASDVILRSLTFWMLGSLSQATWPIVGFVVLFIGTASIVLCCYTKAFNALLLGEAAAHHVGISIDRVKRITLWMCALAIGATVAAAGIIGFVGLVIPHMVRLLMGANHRYVLSGSFLLGGGLLILADIGARTWVAPAELPIGIITALLGAPFFLALILREKKYAL